MAEREGLREGVVRESGGCCGDVCDMAAFEYRADVKDLELDGRHWRELFGGATGSGAKMGAYIVCGPVAYVFFRILMALMSCGILGWSFAVVASTSTFGYWGLYFTNWVVALAAIYFTLAACLTTYAVCTTGHESKRTPILVWLCWVFYGMLVPAAEIGFLIYWLVIFDGVFHAFSLVATAGTLVMVLLDMWVNRQPYYYSFHACFGVTICLCYLIFTVVYWAAGGTDSFGNPYIYRSLYWNRPMSAGKLVMMILLVIFPCFNALFWFLIWARRRVLVAAKTPSMSV